MLRKLYSTLFGRTANQPRAKTQLGLESLEDRLTPNASASNVLVAEAYQLNLHRAPDSGGLAYWSNLVSTEGSAQVFDQIATSPESLTDQIQSLYQSVLHRGADSAGLSYWLGQMQNGSDAYTIESQIMGSAESYAKQGGTASAFVVSLYQGVLNRQPDGAGQNYWTEQLAAGATPTAVAAAIVNSTEAQGDRVNSVYGAALGRPAGAAEVQYWTSGAFANHFDQIASGVFSSAESLNRIQAFLTAPQFGVNANDPNAIAQALLGNSTPPHPIIEIDPGPLVTPKPSPGTGPVTTSPSPGTGPVTTSPSPGYSPGNGSLSNGGNTNSQGFSLNLTADLIVYEAADEGNNADLSGNATVDFLPDGNGGFKFAATIQLQQDMPIQPVDSPDSWDFSGSYTFTGDAVPSGVDSYTGDNFNFYGSGITIQASSWLLTVTNSGASFAGNLNFSSGIPSGSILGSGSFGQD